MQSVESPQLILFQTDRVQSSSKEQISKVLCRATDIHLEDASKSPRQKLAACACLLDGSCKPLGPILQSKAQL
eukprot:4363715-Amphidinium_carterae.1